MRRAGRLALLLTLALAPVLRLTGPVPLSDVALPRREAGLRIGGFSGLAVLDGGATILALSDRGRAIALGVERWGGRAVALTPLRPSWPLRDPDGAPVQYPRFDSEGVALAGRALHVSFEGPTRIWRYGTAWTGSPAALAVPEGGFGPNAGIEALAADAEGRIYAMPERADGSYPIWRLDGTWQEVARLAARPRFRPVGADVGPDGRLYVLERAVLPPLGFAPRIRRVDLASGADRVVFWALPGRFGNLEGIDVWRRDGGGLVASMVTDDNLLLVQRARFVEVRLPD